MEYAHRPLGRPSSPPCRATVKSVSQPPPVRYPSDSFVGAGWPLADTAILPSSSKAHAGVSPQLPAPARSPTDHRAAAAISGDALGVRAAQEGMEPPRNRRHHDRRGHSVGASWRRVGAASSGSRNAKAISSMSLRLSSSLRKSFSARSCSTIWRVAVASHRTGRAARLQA
jgi:hypothetical protein